MIVDTHGLASKQTCGQDTARNTGRHNKGSRHTEENADSSRRRISITVVIHGRRGSADGESRGRTRTADGDEVKNGRHTGGDGRHGWVEEGGRDQPGRRSRKMNKANGERRGQNMLDTDTDANSNAPEGSRSRTPKESRATAVIGSSSSTAVGSTPRSWSPTTEDLSGCTLAWATVTTGSGRFPIFLPPTRTWTTYVLGFRKRMGGRYMPIAKRKRQKGWGRRGKPAFRQVRQTQIPVPLLWSPGH